MRPQITNWSLIVPAESEAQGPGRQRAEEGQWFRLHNQGKTASHTDAGIIKMALAVLDADVRRTMYLQPLLSQDKFSGTSAILARGSDVSLKMCEC